MLYVEKRLDYSAYAPEGFGTGDVIIAANGWMSIIDFKYGAGVPVAAANNLQLMLYGLGGLHEFEIHYDLKVIKTAIFQPRLDNVTEAVYESADLLRWAEDELKPAAELAYAGEGAFNPGEHCSAYFCKAAIRCRARAEKNTELAKYDFADPPLLSDDEIADILLTAKETQKWAGDVWDYAQAEAIKGKTWPNFKLVEGRSNRTYVDAEKVISELIAGGFEADKIAPRKPLGITEMEKAITKKSFKTLLTDEGLVIKPAGKPTLVPAADSRPALGSAESAAKDFEDVETENQ
ncbi:MAG: DUF2800 domain-containing protein [Clostridiales bacterium]|nr:DUF2800 domain-containing protein [Clostridiales bacterium]